MGRSPCCDKTSVKRGPWSREEDAILRSFVQRFANAGNWITLPQKAGLRRCGKSCRLRWLNYLRPALRHGAFTEEEDSLILSLYGQIGSKWSVIAAKLRGRTDNDVKNHWNTKLKKRYFLLNTAPPTPPAGSDSIATTDSTSVVEESPLPVPAPPPAPALANLHTVLATAEDGGGLTHESEQLYAELMGLIEEQSTTSSFPSTAGESMSSSPPPPLGTSPTASSSTTTWPVDVHDTLIQLPESSGRSLVEFDATCRAHALAAAASWLDSFQDLLTSTYDEVIALQEMQSFYV